MFEMQAPRDPRWRPEAVAAFVNAALVLLVPVALLLAFYLTPESGNTVSAQISPRWKIVVQNVFLSFMLLTPFVLAAALVAWRTWVHARQYLKDRTSGWRGVLEAGGAGLCPAAMILIPATIRSPLQAPPYLIAYGGGAMVIGLTCGLLLRATALLVLRRYN